jgi:hypothetical protein
MGSCYVAVEPLLSAFVIRFGIGRITHCQHASAVGTVSRRHGAGVAILY